MAVSLIKNETIKTTLPKAKELRPFVEKILTSGKNQSLHSKRKVYSVLRDDSFLEILFLETLLIDNHLIYSLI